MPVEPDAQQVAEITATYAAAVIAPSPATAAPVTAVVESGWLPAGDIQAARLDWAKLGLDIAAFDAAVKADGHNPTPAVAPDVAAQAADFGLSATPIDPQAYQPVFANARELPPERLLNLNTATRQWASALGLSPAIGTALIEHLSDVGPHFAKMSEAAKADWLSEQRAIGLRVAGSEQSLSETKAKALEALKLADDPLSKNLSQADVLNSFWLISTLANHARAIEAYKAAKR